MNIPTNPKKAPLEMKSIKLYSTGLKKVFTNHFYKSMNHNFGIEITIRNNTNRMQEMKIGGCVYDSNKKINPNSNACYDYYVKEHTFNTMKPGKYIVIFWINDKKVKEASFNITYK